MNLCPIKFYFSDRWVISGDFGNRNNLSADLTCLEEVDII